jgi:hypothetical protein
MTKKRSQEQTSLNWPTDSEQRTSGILESYKAKSEDVKGKDGKTFYDFLCQRRKSRAAPGPALSTLVFNLSDYLAVRVSQR